MRATEFPSVAKLKSWTLAVTAHSRGAIGSGGHYNFERGPGARVTGRIELTPMCIEDALRVRAWLHSLRGRSGSFAMRVPNRDIAPNVCGIEEAHFSDCTEFSDGSAFSDQWIGEASGELAGAASVGDDTVTTAPSEQLSGGVSALAGSETDALVLDFTEDTWALTGHYGAAAVVNDGMPSLGREEADALVLDFTEDEWSATGHYGSAAVRDITAGTAEPPGLFGAEFLQVGDWATIDGQLVRVTAVGNESFTFRPRLRSDVADGAVWKAGRVRGEFRILDDAPIVPLIPGRSREVALPIEEYY